MSEQPAYEATDQGDQALMPIVKPIHLRERLEAMALAPMLPSKAQQPLNIGLFDEDAKNQLALF
jgi:hypothetical protein